MPLDHLLLAPRWINMETVCELLCLLLCMLSLRLIIVADATYILP